MSILFELERLERLLKDLDALRVSFRMPVCSYRRMEGKREDGALCSTEDWKECSIDEPWTALDSHRWYRTEVEIPEEMNGKRAEFAVTTGREGQWDATNPQMLCYVNGKIIQGVDVNHRTVLLDREAAAGSRYEIALLAYSGSVPGDLIVHTDLTAVDEAVGKMYYDMLIPVQTARLLKQSDEDSYRRILSKLGPAADLLDLRKPYSGRFYESLREAEEVLKQAFYTEVREDAPAVYAVGHTHIDIAWLWTVAQTREKAVRSFSTVLELMDRYPEYRFMSSQPILYQFVKEKEPELYERIRERIKEGRWEADGAMWLEADCNLPSGESLVRQIIRGEEFFQKEFGISSKCLWLPDVFGYSAAIPQILKKCGIPYFMTTKIAWNQFNQLPNDTFLWKGIDGSSIFVFMPTTCDYDKMQGLNISFSDRRNTTTYTGIVNPNMTLGTYKRFQNRDLTEDTLMLFGFGDGGGGPTEEMLESAERLKYGLPGIPRIELSGERDFFDRTCEEIAGRPDMPVWNGELYFEYHRGTLTSMGANKRYNRKSEILYESLETIGSMAYLHNLEYPGQVIEKGWDTILLNQFHDIIPGSAIGPVYEESGREYEDVLEAGTQEMKRLSGETGARFLKGVRWNPKTEKPLLVMNSMGYVRNDVVEVRGLENCLFSGIRDGNGKHYEIQYTGEDSLIFFAEGIPSMGYELFFLIYGELETEKKSESVWNGEFENEWYLARFNDRMEVTALIEKKSGCNLMKEGLCGNTLCTYEDRPMNWDNWDLDIYYRKKPYEADFTSAPEVTEWGPVRITVRVEHHFLDSVVEQEIRLYHKLPRIDFVSHADWREHHVLLRTLFPTGLNTVKASYEIQFGNVERETTANHSWDTAKFEVCGHKWCDLSEQGVGLSLLNDCKYGHSVREGEMGLTLIKAGTYPNENADMGHHEFTYSLYPHEGRWQEARTVEMAYDLNVPLEGQVLEAGQSADDGLSPGTWSMVSIDEENCFIEMMKLAEDGDGLILRIYENRNKRTGMHVRLGFFVESVTECDLLERPLKKIQAEKTEFYDFMKPYEIKTYRLRTGKRE